MTKTDKRLATRNTRIHSLFLMLGVLLGTPAMSGGKGDPHYTDAGFFDIHVCNWPDREPFYMAVFATARYDELRSIAVLNAEGEALGYLAMNRFRLINRDGKPDKRAFITQLPLPSDARDGWFQARINLLNGTLITAKDYVIHQLLPQGQGLVPEHNSEAIPMPTELHWEPVPGAKYYQVFIRDLWEGEKLILTSKLIAEPRLELPQGLLIPGGLYAWKVHARDVNEHVYLGDFNNGSQSQWAQFSIANQ